MNQLILAELVIYARYISQEAEVYTCFLAISELPNGIAEAVEQAVTTYLDHKSQLPEWYNLAVMTGKHNGVDAHAHLKHRQPILIGIHYVAHRLALAASQSGDTVPYISCTFKPTIRQLFYFCENSPVRMSGLKAIEQLLQPQS